MNMISIFLQYNLISLPPSGQSTLSKNSLGTLISNLAYYGFCLSKEAYEHLCTVDGEQLVEWWPAVEKALKKHTGDDRKMDDFVVYKNFPQEVLDMTQADYWIRQVLMYWGLPNEIFTTDEKPRASLFEEQKLQVIQLATEESPREIFHSLLSLPARWTDAQQQNTLYLSKKMIEIPLSKIPFKENMICMAKDLLKDGIPVSVQNATDVLRLAVGLSEGDISLRSKDKFRRFNRKERRYLLDMMEQAKYLTEDVFRHPNRWKKLLYTLHPGDYANRFPRVIEVYNKLYNNQKPKGFSSQIEAGFLNRDPNVLQMLQKRPGEFFRRLHHSLLCFGQAAAEGFVEVIPSLTTLQLLKIRCYLRKINNRRYRCFAPKGNWTKLQIVEAQEERKLHSDILGSLDQAISTQLKTRLMEQIPSVQLDPNCERIKLQTNDSELSPYGRGTVFPIPENIRFIRTASYWKKPSKVGNIWYDNGWNFFDSDWKDKGVCCWNQNRLGDAAIFSGDPTNSKDMEGRACQMIDLYLEKLQKMGIRYAVWSILCYSRHNFDAAKDVYAALQWGEKEQEGKLFEPSRCQLSFPVKGSSLTKYIAYIDIEKRHMIYMDANLYGKVQSAHANREKLSEVMPAFVEYLDSLPTVYDLFQDLPQDEEGMVVSYDDAEHQLKGEKAYIFKAENPENHFEAFDINSLISK